MAAQRRTDPPRVIFGVKADRPLATAAGIQIGDFYVATDEGPSVYQVVQDGTSPTPVRSWVSADAAAAQRVFIVTDVAGALSRAIGLQVKDGAGIAVGGGLVRYDWGQPVGAAVLTPTIGTGTLLLTSGPAAVGWALVQTTVGGVCSLVLTANLADTFSLVLGVGEYAAYSVTEAWAP